MQKVTQAVVNVTAADGEASARAAGLRYVSDAAPGITRVRAGRGFTYRDEHGRVVRDRKTLDRIRSLVIPPAWTRVWITTHVTGHLQATGRDAGASSIAIIRGGAKCGTRRSTDAC